MLLKVKFLEAFKDGNILPQSFRAGEIVELDELIVKRIVQSGGVLDILEKRVPKPQKAAKDEA